MSVDKAGPFITWDQRPTLSDFFAVVDGAQLQLTTDAWDRIIEGRKIVEKLLIGGRPVYGLNRGLGSLKQHALSPEQLSHFNQAVWQAHAIVVENIPLPEIEVRALLASRVAGLIRGVSGVRLLIVQRLIDFLNLGLHPVVRARYLSVGEADLAPMAQIACALMGEGEISHNGKTANALKVLESVGFEPIMPEAKDGLALMSSNSYSIGCGILMLREAVNILASANTIGALSYEAYAASSEALRTEIFEARDFNGIRVCGKVFRKLLAGPSLEREARSLQDPLSFRCIAQIHGAIHDVLMQAADTHIRMMGSGNDSPMVISEGLYSNGNFESTALALSLDQVRLALHRLAVISSERVHKLLWGEFSGLPTSLFSQEETKNGMFLNNLSRTLSAMVAEVSSQAFPSGLSSSSQITAGMDDYQSHAPTSLERVRDQIPMMKRILAIEALTAIRAIECRGNPVPPALTDLYNMLMGQARTLFAAGARTVVTNWFDEFPWAKVARMGMPTDIKCWLFPEKKID